MILSVIGSEENWLKILLIFFPHSYSIDLRLCMVFFSLQDFKVLTLLGKGSFACVYRAKSVKTGLEVAIKTVRNPMSAPR